MDALNLFPARVAIGATRDGAPVYASPEFMRALAGLQDRVGGAVAPSISDLALDAALSGPAPLAAQLAGKVEELQLESAGQAVAPFIAALLGKVEELQLEMATLANQAAALAELAKRVAEGQLEGVGGLGVVPPIDWERPGKIGNAVPNSGKFTTLDANSYNTVTITKPGAPATFTLQGGRTLSVLCTLTLTGPDGSVLNVGGGGTLASAAYRDAGDFAIRSAAAHAADATDLPSVITLANMLKAIVRGVGIGT